LEDICSSEMSAVFQRTTRRYIPENRTLYNHPHSLTHSLMELSPSWEAANCAPTRELPSILWNPEFHHRVHISPPPVPIPSQIDPIPTIPSYLRSILILSTHLRLGLPSGLLSFWLSHQYPICIPPLPHSCCMPCLHHRCEKFKSYREFFGCFELGVDSAGGSPHCRAVRIMETAQFGVFVYDLFMNESARMHTS
jgi:hypothetical protein